MDELIRHEGVVTHVEGNTARVSILQASACQACKAQSMCMSADSKQKEMDALMLEPMSVGDRVEVMVRERLAWRAVMLAYMMPFVLMMMVMMVLLYATDWSEAVVGVTSIASIALYYIVLGLFNKRLTRHFSFTARKL